jgi:hypothetical protein
VAQHNAGNLLSGYRIDALPDDADMRPGHDYQLIVNAGERTSGRLYLYDATHQRVAVFNKSGGKYVEQWMTVATGPRMTDVKGILVVEPAVSSSTAPTVLYWLTAKGLMSSPLVSVEPTPGASPSISPSPVAASPTPRRTPPRRTP